ncbi:MAG: hypothetical protein ACYCOU_24220, partial [Sulfobacillus sp.]
SLTTLATLKCNALANRGARKDFLDLYAFLQEGWSLDVLLNAAQQYAPQLNRAHMLRSFTYFTDAEEDPMPRLYRPWAWDEVKRTITHVVQTYMSMHLPPSSPHGPHW